MLSTIDNPYNPFDNWDEWYAWDILDSLNTNRPDCCSYIDKIAQTSSELSDEENDQIIEEAIDEICKLNLSGRFVKLEREIEEEPYLPDDEPVE